MVNPMRVLVTGAGGMLGRDVSIALSRRHQVTALGRKELDITTGRALSIIQDLRPHLVVNCAAYTDVDGCEQNPALAYAVNARGVGNLALACRKIGATLLQFSTDYVFSGKNKHPYPESHPPDPINVYGKSKLAGEQQLRRLLDRYYIVRTSWLFGTGGPNFVSTVLYLAASRGKLAVVRDQLGSPTYTADLAAAAVKLVESQAYGTYHITNSSWCSRYQLARDAIQMAGLKGVEIEPIITARLGRPAKRPAFSVLANQKWLSLGNAPLRHYKKALADYLRHWKGD